tara:strand:- start:2339 stop:2584 length:246 start_codon:yes stop_codon:yes gene_type:complete
MELLEFKLLDDVAHFTVKVGEAIYSSTARTTEQYLFGKMIRRIEYVTDFYIGFRLHLGEGIGAETVLNELRSEINGQLRDI